MLEKVPDRRFCLSHPATFPEEASRSTRFALATEVGRHILLSASSPPPPPQSEGRLVSNSNTALEALWSPGTQQLINTVFLD